MQQPEVGKSLSGGLSAANLRFGIITARWNDFITARLTSGAVETLTRHECAVDAITSVQVPGAFEIPLACQRLARSGTFDALVCLGCVIRGQTPHFDYVAGEAVKGLSSVMQTSGIPVGFGIVTADTLEQAIDRAGGKHGNKGTEAALAAIEMANLLRAIDGK